MSSQVMNSYYGQSYNYINKTTSFFKLNKAFWSYQNDQQRDSREFDMFQYHNQSHWHYWSHWSSGWYNLMDELRLGREGSTRENDESSHTSSLFRVRYVHLFHGFMFSNNVSYTQRYSIEFIPSSNWKSIASPSSLYIHLTTHWNRIKFWDFSQEMLEHKQTSMILVFYQCSL